MQLYIIKQGNRKAVKDLKKEALKITKKIF